MPPRQDLGGRLFAFAVISDSHVNEGEDVSVSPYACNRLANGRLRDVVRRVNRLRPAFTVHLGDMGNPLPELPTYGRAAALFAAITAELRSPLHLVAGNHCVGDKPTGWVPVPRVGAGSLSQYRRVYGGRHYYSFDHGPCHFVVLSSLLVNSGLSDESEQRRWAAEDLAAAHRAGQRPWLLMHYPPYVTDPAELGSYDNVDEPGRSWLLSLLERYDVEAVFTGHVHNYFYNRYAGTDLYTVPATSFVRQDYSELFHVAPADDEGGRNDLAKLGFCLVQVHERGHVAHVVRTFGRVLAPGAGRASSEPPAVEPGVPPSLPWGAEMRESWLVKAALRTNNSVSPFTSRWARNDWALLALREMGISRVRMPLLELSKDDVIERMSTLQEAGFEFLVYSHGAPGEREYRLVRKHRALVVGWELILGLDQVASVARRVAEICGRPHAPGGLPCFLNQIRDIRQARTDDANVKHEANYGFQPADWPPPAEIVDPDLVRRTFTGLVFRLHRRGELEAAPWSAIQEIRDLGRASGLRHQVHLLFSGNLTAERLVDDLDCANRVAESALAAFLAGGVDLWYDTLEDVDRGYFVRHGLVDRRYNPRLAARVLRHLGAEVARPGAGRVREWSVREAGGCRWLTARCDRRRWILILPGEACRVREIATAGKLAGGALRSLDLDRGVVRDLRLTAGPRLELERPLAVKSPLLLIVE